MSAYGQLDPSVLAFWQSRSPDQLKESLASLGSGGRPDQDYMAAQYLGLLGAGGASPEVAGDFWGGLVGGVKGLVTGGITGAIGGAVSGSKGGPPAIVPPGGMGLGGGLIGGIGGAVGTGIINKIAGGLTGAGTNGNGCGCGSSDRDPCTRQKATSQPAPLATFFGGCCPPGRTLRRVNNGRDICAKTAKMNPFNPRALARADKRVTAFAQRAAPMLKDLGFSVSRSRAPKIKTGKRRRR